MLVSRTIAVTVWLAAFGWAIAPGAGLAIAPGASPLALQDRDAPEENPAEPPAETAPAPNDTLDPDFSPFDDLPPADGSSEGLVDETEPVRPLLRLDRLLESDGDALDDPGEGAYVLGPGDRLIVEVVGYEEFQNAQIQAILPDGTIALPLVGSVRAEGLTVDGLSARLTDRLSEYLVQPAVTVRLNQLRPISISVAGQVNRPGPLQLGSLTDGIGIDNNNGGGLGGTPTLSAAIVAAGGVRRDADIREVVLRRPLPSGEVQEETIDLWASIWSGEVSRDPILRDGDSVFVPQLPDEETLDRRLLARSRFAPETVRVRVVGEVKLPGEVLVPPDSTLSSAVAIAGGPTVDAELDDVAFLRLRADGTVAEEIVDLRSLNDTIQIQEGDVIYVGKRESSAFLDFLNRLPGPGGLLINLFSTVDRIFLQDQGN